MRGLAVGLSLLAVLGIAAQLSGCRTRDETKPGAPISSFKDVPSTHPFVADILKIAGKGITHGCTADSYCPDAPVTPAQMALFIERIQGPSNVPADSADRVTPLTHAQMAAMIVKAKGVSSFSANAPQTFCDVPPGHPLYGAINYYANTLGAWPGCGAISGNNRSEAGCNANCDNPSRRFCPDCPVTRGETAYILTRAFSL